MCKVVQRNQTNQKYKSNLLTEHLKLLEIFLDYNKRFRDKLLRDIRTLYELKDDYYEPVRVGNFWSSNYDEYESNGDKNKTISIEEYLTKYKPYLRVMVNYLQRSDI